MHSLGVGWKGPACLPSSLPGHGEGSERGKSGPGERYELRTMPPGRAPVSRPFSCTTSPLT